MTVSIMIDLSDEEAAAQQAELDEYNRRNGNLGVSMLTRVREQLRSQVLQPCVERHRQYLLAARVEKIRQLPPQADAELQTVFTKYDTATLTGELNNAIVKG